MFNSNLSIQGENLWLQLPLSEPWRMEGCVESQVAFSFTFYRKKNFCIIFWKFDMDLQKLKWNEVLLQSPVEEDHREG